MCSPEVNYVYRDPPEILPCLPVQGPKCLPCGMDSVTVRRPLIVNDSTFDYRPTSYPGMLLNNQDKKVRYQLVNYARPVLRGSKAECLCLISPLVNAQSEITLPVMRNLLQMTEGGCGAGCQGPCCRPCCAPCCAPCCGGGGAGSLITVYNAVLAVGSPPHPVAAFDKAIIAIGHHRGPGIRSC